MPSSACDWSSDVCSSDRSEEHTSELQSRSDLVCRLLLEKKKNTSELQSRSDIVCRLLLEKKNECNRKGYTIKEPKRNRVLIRSFSCGSLPWGELSSTWR